MTSGTPRTPDLVAVLAYLRDAHWHAAGRLRALSDEHNSGALNTMANQEAARGDDYSARAQNAARANARGDTSMIITLSVKEGDGAEGIALGKLNAWFTEGGHDAPFPPGTLLHYSVHREEESHESPYRDAGPETGAYLTRERAVARGPATDAEWFYGNSPAGLRMQAAEDLAAEFGNDVSEWTV